MSFYHNQLFPVDFYKVNSKKIINKFKVYLMQLIIRLKKKKKKIKRKENILKV